MIFNAPETIVPAFKRAYENGNVLFLILIAVALFSALSYAVTQSNFSAPGGGDDTSGRIQASKINQYPTTVQAQILRMIMNNVEIDALEFNPPADFGALSDVRLGVFHPQFGTSYVRADPQLMANEQQASWIFNMNFEIKNIGESVAGSPNGNEIMAFLPGVRQNICQRVNETLNITTIPAVNDAAYYNGAIENMDNTYTPPASEIVIGDTNLPEFERQQYGCYQETASSNQYIYFFAMIER